MASDLDLIEFRVAELELTIGSTRLWLWKQSKSILQIEDSVSVVLYLNSHSGPHFVVEDTTSTGRKHMKFLVVV
jgi:hypothetical protein